MEKSRCSNRAQSCCILRAAIRACCRQIRAAKRAIEWLFAALSSVEPWIYSVQLAAVFERDQPWSAERLPHALAQLDARLADLSAALGDGPWLDGDTFTAGDLMMIAVLRQVSRIGALDRHPNLAAYVARGEARPAFARALAAQMDDFEQRAA